MHRQSRWDVQANLWWDRSTHPHPNQHNHRDRTRRCRESSGIRPIAWQAGVHRPSHRGPNHSIEWDSLGTGRHGTHWFGRPNHHHHGPAIGSDDSAVRHLTHWYADQSRRAHHRCSCPRIHRHPCPAIAWHCPGMHLQGPEDASAMQCPDHSIRRRRCQDTLHDPHSMYLAGSCRHPRRPAHHRHHRPCPRRRPCIRPHRSPDPEWRSNRSSSSNIDHRCSTPSHNPSQGLCTTESASGIPRSCGCRSHWSSTVHKYRRRTCTP